MATGSVHLTKPQGTTGESTTYSSPLVDVFDQESRIIVSVQDRYQRLAKYWKSHRMEDKLKVGSVWLLVITSQIWRLTCVKSVKL